MFHGVFFISLRGIAANHGMFSLATWHVFKEKEQKDKAEYVLLFFCLKNIAHFHSPETRTSLFSRECKLQKGIFGQFNTLKFIYLRLDPLHPDNQTIKSLSVPPDNSGTKTNQFKPTHRRKTE